MKNSETKNIQSHSRNTVLCDGFLIPMTDFVLRINEIEKEIDQFFDSWRMKQLRIIENYAKFLKQPLKLEMFVPCDEDGNVLEEYKRSEAEILADKNSYCRYISKEEAKWNKAKENVLFEGFEEMKNAAVRDCVWIKDTETRFHIDTRYGTTVEQLIKSNLKLTQTALNAIFG